MQHSISVPVSDSNTQEIGLLMYQTYWLPFEYVKLILLSAMISAIGLLAQGHQQQSTKVFLNKLIVAKKIVLLDEAMIGLEHYLGLAAVIFAIGMLGIVLNRNNLIVILMCMELMLLSVNINFVAIDHYLNFIDGQVMVFFILAIAAGEAAIGLAIFIVLYRENATIETGQLLIIERIDYGYKYHGINITVITLGWCHYCKVYHV